MYAVVNCFFIIVMIVCVQAVYTTVNIIMKIINYINSGVLGTTCQAGLPSIKFFLELYGCTLCWISLELEVSCYETRFHLWI